MINANIILHIEIKTNLIYSFKSEIQRGAGEIVHYSKALTSPPGMSTSLGEIQAYIVVHGQKRLDLYNVEPWSKVYSTTTRTTERKSNY